MPTPVYCKTGVYAIRNIQNGKVYVGGAYKCFALRRRIHWRDLRAGHHGNQHLQNSWNRDGPLSFVFCVLERCQPLILEERETYWIARLNATNREFGYNKSPTGGSPLGTKHPPEYGARISARNFEMSDATRAKIGAASKGRMPSEETKRKLSLALKGRERPPEVVKKITAILKGKKRGPEALLRITLANRSRVNTPELRFKCGSGSRGRKQSLEEVSKRAAANTGRKRTPEQCERIAASLRGKKRSPQAVANAAEALRRSRAAESVEERKKYGVANIGVNRRNQCHR